MARKKEFERNIIFFSNKINSKYIEIIKNLDNKNLKNINKKNKLTESIRFYLDNFNMEELNKEDKFSKISVKVSFTKEQYEKFFKIREFLGFKSNIDVLKYLIEKNKN